MRFFSGLLAAGIVSLLMLTLSPLPVVATLSERTVSTLASNSDTIKLSREQKQLPIDTLNQHLASFSAQKTERMTHGLQKLTNLVNKLTEKEHSLSQSGIDTTDAKKVLTNAHIAITRAQEAVASQSARQYNITTDSQQDTKTSAHAMINQMQKELKETRQYVIDAKKAVHETITTLKNAKTKGAIHG